MFREGHRLFCVRNLASTANTCGASALVGFQAAIASRLTATKNCVRPADARRDAPDFMSKAAFTSLLTQVKAPENVYVAGDWIADNRMERHLVMVSLRIKIDSEPTLLGMSFLEFIS
ncbi:hypothetical protein GXB78_08600 [Pseudomonas moraviensis subsp. stanleyae]|uniref:hypothetical protein n=1 Tax=Pseudomonas moraviensis TaxID=321662 RepID=UPI002E375163|nr:hypothetical protein [Pseudomonas moraviensis]MED7667255.1 hypothetical protein [Pseudomonas moraviensis subsp. stanleyae]